jgi:hypothetical protein
MGLKQKEALRKAGLNPKHYKVIKQTPETLYLKHWKTGKITPLRW